MYRGQAQIYKASLLLRQSYFFKLCSEGRVSLWLILNLNFFFAGVFTCTTGKFLISHYIDNLVI